MFSNLGVALRNSCREGLTKTLFTLWDQSLEHTVDGADGNGFVSEICQIRKWPWSLIEWLEVSGRWDL